MPFKILCALITVTVLFGEIRAKPRSSSSEYPLPYQPHRATPQYFSSPVNAVPTPGHLSYDYASGNRKLLNKVHIPLRGNPTQPQPVGALPLNYDSSDGVPTFQRRPLPSNPNIVPLGALPLNDQTGNTNTFKPEDLTPEPIDTIGASPIPVKPNDSSNSDDSKSTITFNPSDIPYQPVSNIEASPIPIRPKVNGSKKNEDLSPLPSDDAVGPSIPNQPENNNDGDASDNENTLTINPGDLTPVPTDTIAASPIPIKSKNNQPPSLEASNITEPQVGNDEPRQKNDGSSNDQSEAPEDNETPRNPLKDLVLNGTSSGNSLGENPLKDHLFNGSSTVSEETESESSKVENSGPNQETTETESRESSQEYSDNGDGIQSSKTEEQESEVVETEEESN